MMEPLTAKELEDLKKQWQASDNVEFLQNNGYITHMKLKNERKDRKCIEEILRSNLDALQLQEIQQERSNAVFDKLFTNFKDLINSINDLGTKDNGEPLNNEMAQVLKLVNDAKKKCNADIKKCDDNYVKRLHDRARLQLAEEQSFMQNNNYDNDMPM